MRSKLILIGGMSRSGKSRLAKELTATLSNAAHIDQDNFVKDQALLPLVHDRIDWEQPETIDWLALRSEVDRQFNKVKYVILEGIFAFNDFPLVERAAIRVYLTLDKPQFLEKRSAETRWGDEPAWYLEHVWNTHHAIFNPFELAFDMIGPYREELSTEIYSMLK
jgi:nicotinamide/nicotinate riboside kinase